MASYTGVSAAIWSFFEKLSSQAVSFVIGIVLARLLTPYDYGVVGLTAIFIAVSNVFIEAGFANALIQNQHRTEKDLSTAMLYFFPSKLRILFNNCSSVSENIKGI